VSELGIERLCLFGMPPVDHARLAAELGCSCIGIGLTPVQGCNPHAYADWSLREDAKMRRDLVRCMADLGVRISLLEGFGVAPGEDVRRFEADLDLLCEMKGDRINVVSLDMDIARTIEQFGVLAELARGRGIEVCTEIGPGPIHNLATAVMVAEAVKAPNFKLLIDTMHFFRFGSTVQELAAVDPSLIGYVQLCDAPAARGSMRYMDEAFYERMVPGEGELPLPDLLSLIPPDVVISLEVPQRSLAVAGQGPNERVGRCVAAAREMLAATRR